MTKTDYMTEDEVAEIWRLKVETLRKKRYTDSQHPPYIKLGARILYPRSDFFDWLNRQTVRPKAK